MPHLMMTAQADDRQRESGSHGHRGSGDYGRTVRLSAQALALTLAMLIAQGLPAAELQSRTLASWENYIRLTERRVDSELGDGRKFLAEDFLAAGNPQESRALLEKGQVSILRMNTVDGNGREIPVPDGMIHHWLGGIFVPGVALESLLEWLQNYDQHERYFMEVEKSQLLSREGPEFRIFYRLRRKKVITVFYNTLHTVVYRQQDPRHASSRTSHPTRSGAP